MADLTFSQPARRNLLLPIAIALAVLAAAGFFLLRYSPRSTADISVTGTATYPIHSVFKSESIVVGRDQVQDDLYVLVDLRLQNQLRLPLFLKDFTADLVPADNAPDGNAPMASSAVEKPDLQTLYATFPAIAKVAAGQNLPPLFRETQIDPGQTVTGFLLLHFPTTQATWNTRQSASITIAFYHQPPITIPIPNISSNSTPTSK